jgi:putative ATP-dependent endonuclease of OLD family
MPYFARNLGISLDSHCISIIMAQGESSIEPLKKLFDCFQIPCICVYDGDVRSKRVTDAGVKFFTNELCFELEVLKKLYEKEKYDIIRNIATDLNKQADKIVLDADYVKEGFKYLGRSLEGYTPKKLTEIDPSNANEYCTMYAVWYMKSKGVISGRVYGMNIPKDCIPQCYIDVFNKALEIVEL